MVDKTLHSSICEFKVKHEIKELSWSGRNAQGGWACDIAELVVAQFPDIEFRICDSWDLDAKYGLSENGKIRWLELSSDINEMFEWGIDVDPYVGPTPEQLEELRQHRRARVQEMIAVAGGGCFGRVRDPLADHIQPDQG